MEAYAWQVDIRDMKLNCIFLSSNILFRDVIGEIWYLISV